MPDFRVDDDLTPYPDSTIDFVKVIRERGLDVRYELAPEDRRYAGHKAAEHWLPILEIARDVLIGIEAGLLVELIKGYFGDDEPDKELLHVDWRVTHEDGSEERFIADGHGDEVIEALDAFERRLRDE